MYTLEQRQREYLRLMRKIENQPRCLFFLCLHIKGRDTRLYPELWSVRPRTFHGISTNRIVYPWYNTDAIGMERRYDRLVEAYLLTFL